MNEPIVEPILAVEFEVVVQDQCVAHTAGLRRRARAGRRYCDHDLSRMPDRGRGAIGRPRFASLALGCAARGDDPGKARAWRRCRKPRRQSRRHRHEDARRRIRARALPRPNWRSFSSHGSALGSTSVSCPSRGLSLSNFAATAPKTSRRCVQRSPQPFPRPILTIIGCGRRASAPWPMPSSFSPPLFSC